MNLPTNPSPSTIARNPHLWAFKSFQERAEAPEAVKVPPEATGAFIGQKKRIRQSSKSPNKWELEWAKHLSGWSEHIVMSHAIKLCLASGCWYEPDIVVFDQESGSILAYEVKGFARDDAVVKLKVAARAYPWIAFWLVWKEKGLWKQQRVVP